MWELDHKEGWALKNWCFWTVVLEKTLESPLDCKEIQPVNPKGNQPWIFIGRTDAETEAPLLWPPDVKTWFIRKDPDAGKDWGQEEKGMTEDEIVGWHHWLNGHEFEQASGDGEGQGSLVCCNPWECRVGHDWETEQQIISEPFSHWEMRNYEHSLGLPEAATHFLFATSSVQPKPAWCVSASPPRGIPLGNSYVEEGLQQDPEERVLADGQKKKKKVLAQALLFLESPFPFLGHW